MKRTVDTSLLRRLRRYVKPGERPSFWSDREATEWERGQEAEREELARALDEVIGTQERRSA